jgi:hypothetical protein
MPYFKQNGKVYFVDPSSGDLFEQQERYVPAGDGLGELGGFKSFFKKVGKAALKVAPLAASVIPGGGAVAMGIKTGLKATGNFSGGGGGGGKAPKMPEAPSAAQGEPYIQAVPSGADKSTGFSFSSPLVIVGLIGAGLMLSRR